MRKLINIFDISIIDPKNRQKIFSKNRVVDQKSKRFIFTRGFVVEMLTISRGIFGWADISQSFVQEGMVTFGSNLGDIIYKCFRCCSDVWLSGWEEPGFRHCLRKSQNTCAFIFTIVFRFQ